jgi:asparagine synthase (glutamine-hydrolysing)
MRAAPDQNQKAEAMSVQFGRWNFDGSEIEPHYLDKVRNLLRPYGPDGQSEYTDRTIHLLYFPFHTTRESGCEAQPLISPSGAVLTWDGRLDNRMELIRQLGGPLHSAAPDVAIVGAAYDRWAQESFSKLAGDWALSVWQPAERSLTLATDFLGSRHLYYSLSASGVIWSSVLDPLVLCGQRFPPIAEEYVAGWLGFFPAAHVTPYCGIFAVRPASYLLVRGGQPTAHAHSPLDPTKRIRYQKDGDYEEHFRSVFFASVARRLRSDSPILAELSGGMDSSSIVCVADTLVANGSAETPRIDTLSYYDDSEPNWNELPYLEEVERQRGRAGAHINLSQENSLTFEFNEDSFASTPCAKRCSRIAAQCADYMRSNGHRVLLSGIGGDELAGGVPSPCPELADHFSTGQFRLFATQLKRWALAKRKPWFQLFLETLGCFLPEAIASNQAHRRPVPWLNRRFADRYRAAITGYHTRRTFLGPLPSTQENLETFDGLRREIACSALVGLDPLCETRYPFLDRDLVEFLFAVPREQLVRPGERRSLMRRALAGIVPKAILNRPRKGYVARSHLAELHEEYATLDDARMPLICEQLGIVNAKEFARALSTSHTSRNVPLVAILRTLHIEAWLRHVEQRYSQRNGDHVNRERSDYSRILSKNLPYSAAPEAPR